LRLNRLIFQRKAIVPIGAQSNEVKYLLADVDTDYRQ
jgi:hypothetical protein